jgi:hypothetical protein
VQVKPLFAPLMRNVKMMFAPGAFSMKHLIVDALPAAATIWSTCASVGSTNAIPMKALLASLPPPVLNKI